MQTPMRMFIGMFLFFGGTNFAVSEELPKVSGFDTWRSINHFDRGEYQEQQKKLLKLGVLLPFEDGLEKCKSIAEILRLTEDASHQPKKGMFLERFSLEENGIAGYRNTSSDVFWVEPKQWREQFSVEQFVDSHPSNPKINVKVPRISVEVHVYDSAETARLRIVRVFTSGSAPLQMYVSLYRIEKGPGDVCLVAVNSRILLSHTEPHTRIDTAFLSDKQIVFVRGNVAVCMTSSYKNFGCMDLACKLDALIVKQMHEEAKKR